jgi:hypothetical protein
VRVKGNARPMGRVGQRNTLCRCIVGLPKTLRTPRLRFPQASTVHARGMSIFVSRPAQGRETILFGPGGVCDTAMGAGCSRRPGWFLRNAQ